MISKPYIEITPCHDAPLWRGSATGWLAALHGSCRQPLRFAGDDLRRRRCYRPRISWRSATIGDGPVRVEGWAGIRSRVMCASPKALAKMGAVIDMGPVDGGDGPLGRLVGVDLDCSHIPDAP